MPVRISAGISRGRMYQTSERPVRTPSQGSPGSFQYATSANSTASDDRMSVGRSKPAVRSMRALYTGTVGCYVHLEKESGDHALDHSGETHRVGPRGAPSPDGGRRSEVLARSRRGPRGRPAESPD